MRQTATVTETQGETTVDRREVHAVCCDDGDLARCGADRSGLPSTDREISCPVCKEFEREYHATHNRCAGCPLTMPREVSS
jgi:hypothetical protein